jgi:pilus assembly protein FimV
VNFLVDLHWRHGDLVRQYTLLLDPAGFDFANRVAQANRAAEAASVPPAPAAPDVPATPPVAAPIVETKTQTVARQVDPPNDQPDPAAERAVRKTTHIKVGAKATLRGVAWRVGERSESGLQRLMIAIFRVNPNAFDGNINRLHRGAVLTIPSHAEVASISKAEAKREVHGHMVAWLAPARAVTASAAAAATPVPAANVPTTPAALPDPAISSGAIDKASDTLETQALGRRVQSMEQELSEMKGLLESERNQLLEMRQQAVRADITVPTVAPQTVNAPHAQLKSGYTALIPIVGGLGILSAALAALYVKLRRRVPALKISLNDEASAANAAAAEAVITESMADALLDGTHGQRKNLAQESAREHVQDGVQTCASDDTRTDAGARTAANEDDATHPLLPVIPGEPAVDSEIAAGASPRAVPQDATVNLHVDTVSLRMDPTQLDYNFLELTAQHVQMPSALNEHAVVKERRTSLAEVLKVAIEREPDRHDLRMKLLELYYTAAATNRKAFLETVQKFARDRDFLQADQWDKIAYMGRQIASDNPMFIEESAADDDLADCA